MSLPSESLDRCYYNIIHGFTGGGIMADHEYRVVQKNYPAGAEGSSNVMTDPKAAGDVYRKLRKMIATNPGASAELQKREVRPWETVDKFTIPNPDVPTTGGGDS